MEIKYFNQYPSRKFEILDKINITCDDKNGAINVHIYPFKVKAYDAEYSFPGLNTGSWSPVFPCALVAEIDHNKNLVLTVVTSDLFDSMRGDNASTLGIIAFFTKDTIIIINHKGVGLNA